MCTLTWLDRKQPFLIPDCEGKAPDQIRRVVIRSAEDEAQAVADLLDLEGLAHSSVPGEA